MQRILPSSLRRVRLKICRLVLLESDQISVSSLLMVDPTLVLSLVAKVGSYLGTLWLGRSQQVGFEGVQIMVHQTLVPSFRR